MNGKKVKMLRKAARAMTVGMPVVQYEDKALNQRKPTRRTRFMHNCTKLVLRNLKKAYVSRRRA